MTPISTVKLNVTERISVLLVVSMSLDSVNPDQYPGVVFLS